MALTVILSKLLTLRLSKHLLPMTLLAIVGSWLPSSTSYAQGCRFQVATPGHPARCVALSSNGRCSPVDIGSGPSGTCRVQGGEECICVGSATPTPTPTPKPTPTPTPTPQPSPTPNPTGPVWGWADLHAHPATHLGFGADSTGHNGLVWGVPMSFSGVDSIAQDLLACDPSTHDSAIGSSDFLAKSVHQRILQGLDKTTNFNSTGSQGPFGWPSFATWPDARSVSHQQMHITALRRAFDGGLRLMFADATDNQLLTRLWLYHGENSIDPSAGFDAVAAVPQLQYIRQLAAANSSWMQVVDNPADARIAINANKLAIVLGVEMDWLSPQDIDMLYRTQGVRHVIPIHLADNLFGGTAVYNSVFDSNSQYLSQLFFNNQWEHISWDSCVNFQFGDDKSDLTTVSISTVFGAVSWPSVNQIDQGTFQTLYTPPASCGPDQANGFHACGMLNAQAANKEYLLMLMEHPLLLLDVAHMSQAASDATLSLAEGSQYPVMDSHTGIRDNNPATCLVKARTAMHQIDERSLPSSQAQRIAALGGVIGLSTARNPFADPSEDAVGEWVSDYLKLQSLGFANGKGIALGTDTNGLSWQMPFDMATSDSSDNLYGVDRSGVRLVSLFNPPPGVNTNPLPQYTANNKTYDFPSMGIAVYGMLPDFLAAANIRLQASNTDLRAMFHTAEDVIEMWEKMPAASANVPCGAGNKCCSDITGVGFCRGACVKATDSCPAPPPPACPTGEKCCGGTDSAGHCLGSCIANTSTCNNTNSCPGGQHCCSGLSADGVCIAGCIANAQACQPLCGPGTNTCCASPGPTGKCSGACIKSPPAVCQ